MTARRVGGFRGGVGGGVGNLLGKGVGKVSEVLDITPGRNWLLAESRKQSRNV